MPNPALSDVHVNRPLTNIAIAFAQSQDAFIAGRATPIVPVAKKSDSYFLYSRDDWYRIQARERAPGAEAPGGGFDLTTDTYTATVYAVRKDVDDQIRANADAPLNVDRDATEWCTLQLLLKREKVWSSTFFAASTWTGSTTGADITVGTQWNDAASDPITDVTNQIIGMAQKTGYKPNKMVIGPNVWAALKNHPDILDRVKYTQKGIVTRELLASLFDVDEVLVPFAVEVTSAEDATTDTYAFVYGKNALLMYASPSASLMTPSAGYIFNWTGLIGSGRDALRIKKYRMEQNSADRVEGESAFVPKVIAADLGVYFTSVVA